MPAPDRAGDHKPCRAGGSLGPSGKLGPVGYPNARGVNRAMVDGNLRQPKLAFGYGLDQLD